ncbi:MAG: hypothetical protein ABIH21_01025 [Patescibacteria group bacterium]
MKISLNEMVRRAQNPSQDYRLPNSSDFRGRFARLLEEEYFPALELMKQSIDEGSQGRRKYRLSATIFTTDLNERGRVDPALNVLSMLFMFWITHKDRSCTFLRDILDKTLIKLHVAMLEKDALPCDTQHDRKYIMFIIESMLANDELPTWVMPENWQPTTEGDFLRIT